MCDTARATNTKAIYTAEIDIRAIDFAEVSANG